MSESSLTTVATLPLKPHEAGGRTAMPRPTRSLLHWIIAQCLHPGVFSLLDQALVSGTSFFTAMLIARAARMKISAFTTSL